MPTANMQNRPTFCIVGIWSDIRTGIGTSSVATSPAMLTSAVAMKIPVRLIQWPWVIL